MKPRKEDIQPHQLPLDQITVCTKRTYPYLVTCGDFFHLNLRLTRICWSRWPIRSVLSRIPRRHDQLKNKWWYDLFVATDNPKEVDQDWRKLTIVWRKRIFCFCFYFFHRRHGWSLRNYLDGDTANVWWGKEEEGCFGFYGISMESNFPGGVCSRRSTLRGSSGAVASLVLSGYASEVIAQLPNYVPKKK